jgi:hypothetical protein
MNVWLRLNCKVHSIFVAPLANIRRVRISSHQHAGPCNHCCDQDNAHSWLSVPIPELPTKCHAWVTAITNASTHSCRALVALPPLWVITQPVA